MLRSALPRSSAPEREALRRFGDLAGLELSRLLVFEVESLFRNRRGVSRSGVEATRQGCGAPDGARGDLPERIRSRAA